MLRLFETRSQPSFRWGWLLLSLGLLAAAGFFLYPSLESFTTPTHKAIVEVREPPLPPAMPVERPPQPAPVKPPKPKPATQPRKLTPVTLAAKPVRQIAPSAPEGIRNRIRGEVRVEVRLHVGKNGRVTGAKLLTFSHDGVQAYLGQQALQAVRQWKFQPAPAAADRTVRFRFRRSGTQWSIVA